MEQLGFYWPTHEQEYANNYIDCFDKISNQNVLIKEIDFREIGFYNEAAAVHKSDFIRWFLLSTVGGLWADMDILFIKSMNDLYFNTEDNRSINTVYCIEPNKGYHSIGFLMGSKNNGYFRTIHKHSISAYKREAYQSIGSELCDKLFHTIQSTFIDGVVPHNLNMEAVYAYNGHHVKEIFNFPSPMKLTRKSIGIHWYAGHQKAGEYLNLTNGGLTPNNNSVINKQIEKFYEHINSNGIL